MRLLADVSLPPSPPRLLAFDKPRMPKLVLTRVRAHRLPRLNIKWHGGIGGAKPDAYLKFAVDPVGYLHAGKAEKLLSSVRLATRHPSWRDEVFVLRPKVDSASDLGLLTVCIQARL